jgi:GAF domain-containing protein
VIPPSFLPRPQVARAREDSRVAYSWQEMRVLEHLAAKVATTLSMQTLRKASSKYEERLRSMAHVWDDVAQPTQAMERTLHNMRQDFHADVCSLYEVTNGRFTSHSLNARPADFHA